MTEMCIQLSGLWCVLMLVYFFGDLLRIFSEENAQQYAPETRFRQPIWLGISMLTAIPILMVVLILMLPQPVGRWANIVMPGLILFIDLMGLPNDLSTYDKFLIVVGVILNCVTFWLTWNMAVI